jgi:hypothetical protein
VAPRDVFTQGCGTFGFFLSPMPYRGGTELQAVGPVEFTSKGTLLYAGLLCQPVFSDHVKQLGCTFGALGQTLYIPKTAKFVPLRKAVTIMPFRETAPAFAHLVEVEKGAAAGTVRLRGQPLGDARWGQEKLAALDLTYGDAAFVLGALGIPEDAALHACMEATVTGKGRVTATTVLRAPTEPTVSLGYMKLAAALPQQADRLMAIQMLGSKTIDGVLDKLPAIKEFMDDIAVTTLAAQLGLGGVDEAVAYQALRNLQELVRQLEQLKTERGLLPVGAGERGA